MSLPIGAVLVQRYRVIERLGEGGMGSVYKAEDLRLAGKLWAIKELQGDAFTSSAELHDAIRRFDTEIATMARLSNPQIPAVVDRFAEGGQHYFVMEFIPGQSLERMLNVARVPLDEGEVLRWMIQVCEVLIYLHGQQPPIILRDLKPGNIMITPAGEVKLIDFGIARTYKFGKTTNTENLGTMTYASPEHLGQTGQTDARSDIYSLGATMYHLLTAQEPIPMETPAPGSMRNRNPRLSPAVEQVVIKAMQLDPARRFQSALAMQNALRACLAPTTGAMPVVPRPISGIVAPLSAPQPVLAPYPQPPISSTGQGVGGGVRVVGPVCPLCGFVNRPGAKFCGQDRTPLTAAMASGPGIATPGVGYSRIAAPSALEVYHRGLAASQTGHWAEAAQQLRQAIALGHADYDTYLRLGLCYRCLGQLREAVMEFEQATQFRQDAEAYFQLGTSYRELRLYPQARAALAQARQLAPTDPAVWYQLGMISLDAGMPAQAEAEFQAGLRLDPHHYLLLCALGDAQRLQGKWPAAIATLRQATEAEHGQPEAWVKLGEVYLQAGQYQAALQALQQALHLQPDNASVHSLLASVYSKLRKKRQAREAASRALQLDPNNASAQRLLKQLA
jgi:tetratricopeptide (TPR) repeat protein